MENLTSRLETLEKQLSLAMTRIHKGVIFLTHEVELFREEYKQLAKKMDEMSTNNIVRKLNARDHQFPLDSHADLLAYLDDDPQAQLLVERLVIIKRAYT